MAAGQQALHQGNYANAEQILVVAMHHAEEFDLEDRQVASTSHSWCRAMLDS